VADNSTLIKLAVAGGVGYFAYTQGWLSFLGMSPAGSTTPPPGAQTNPPAAQPPATTPATTTPPTTPTTPATSVLDGIFARIQASAGANAQLNPDDWGWYLNNELSALGRPAAPDPVPLFGARPQPTMGAAAWWGPMSAALKSQLGLSGLGVYGGLAAMARRYRRVA